MKYSLLLLLPVFCFAGLQEQVEKTLQQKYVGVDLKFEKKMLQPELKKQIEQKSGQSFQQNFVYFWEIDSKEQTWFAIVDAVRGKSASMIMMTVFSSNGIVDHIEFINYTGSHGREVMQQSWLQQFIGAHKKSELVLGSDIDAVSGATISAQAVCKALKRWSLLADAFKQQIY